MNKEKQEKNEKKLDPINHYLKYIFLSDPIVNTLIIIISILVLIIEFAYRQPLFDYSLEFERKWQDKSSIYTINFFKFITKVGGEYCMAIPVAFTLCFYSLIKSTIYIAGFLFCLQFHSMMKIWYASSRPFWERPNLYKGICDGGFGNPSGHSMSSVYLYLTLFVYLKEKKCFRNKCIQLALLILCLVWTILIILSRLILGIHAVNQVIFGSTLGLIVFLFSSIVFKLHKMPIHYFKKLFKDKKYISFMIPFQICLTVLTIINKFAINVDVDVEEYNKIIDQCCGIDYPIYRRFHNDALYGSFTIFAVMGMYIGLIIFWYLIDNKYKKNKEENNDNENSKNICDNLIENNNNYNLDTKYSLNDIETGEEIRNEMEVIDIKKDEDNIIIDVASDNNHKNNKENNNENYNEEDNENDNENFNKLSESELIDKLVNNWYRNRVLLFGSIRNIFKIILVILLCCSPGILFVAIPKNSSLTIIFVVKLAIPFFFILFLLYSFGFYYIIKIGCGTKEVVLKRLKKKFKKRMKIQNY